MKDWTGKTHQIEIVTAKLIDADTGLVAPGWYTVEGVIDGQGLMLDTPVSYPHLTSARYSMERALDRFLEGRHHPTHYTASHNGRFAYLARQ